MWISDDNKVNYRLTGSGYYDSENEDGSPSAGATYRKVMTFDLDAMVDSGEVLDFYGAHSCVIKLGKTLFLEVLENPSDGYRSYYETTVITEDPGGFFDQPIAKVRFDYLDDGADKFYALRDVGDDHVWLLFGTTNTNNYYPSFTFNYTPKEGTEDQ